MSVRYPGTDKDYPHHYVPDYLRIADEIGQAAAVCEIGVWHGGSLAMWQDLFPCGLVIGVDVDPASTWPPGTCRIVMKQNDPGLAQAVTELAPAGLDLVVDDASHIGALTAATFGTLWPLVKPGRYYVIEDWTTAFDLGRYAPSMIGAVQDGAATVTYTCEGLIIVKRAAS
jgi:cephalosporin hydroxylase